MVLLNFSYHYYLRFFQPNIRELSYVDNLELMGSTPAEVHSGFLLVESWLSMFRLRLDSKKTQFWAIKPADRHLLRSLGLSVVESSSDLGVSMLYCASHRNLHMQSRIRSVQPFWARLRTLRASQWHKILAVKVALLPRALHSSSLIFIGECWFGKLRTQIMKGLRYDRAGANPILRIGFVCSLDIEPGFYDAWRTIRNLVLYLQRSEYVRNNWEVYFWATTLKRTHGPFAKFMRILDKLSCTLDDPYTLRLSTSFTLQLGTVDFAVLKMVAEYAWRQFLVRSVSKRKDFCDLDGINTEASFFQIKELDKSSSELLNCIRDGTFFLNSTKAKFDESVPATCRCGLGIDTIAHRALECPLLLRTRQQFQDVVDMWSYLPVSMTHHGICSQNPFQFDYWNELCSISWEPPAWRHGPVGNGIQHLFTDGSCSDPASPLLALAGWSVVSADFGEPLGVGLLPGVLHNSNRSEVWAIAMAIQWLLDYGCDGMIFTDSSYAMKGCMFLQQHLRVPSDWVDRDLWIEILKRLQILSTALTFRKVAAHRAPTSGVDDLDNDIIHWNSIADTSAKVARSSGLPERLSQVYCHLKRYHQWQAHWAKRCQMFLLSLALQSLSGSDSTEPYRVEAELEDEFVCEGSICSPNFSEWADLMPLDLWRYFGTCFRFWPWRFCSHCAMA